MKSLFKRTKNKRLGFFITADIIFVAASVWLAFLARFDGQIPDQYGVFILEIIFVAVIIVIPVFYFHKLYAFSWSYVGTSELISLLRAVTVSFAFLVIAMYALKYFTFFNNFPRSVFFISYLLVFILCGGLRFSKRVYSHFSRYNFVGSKERTLIIGAGDAGEQILRSIISSKNSNYFPVGFADDNPIKKGVLIHGLKVLGKTSDVPRLVKDYRLDGIIIAMPSAGRKLIKNAVEISRRAGIKKIRIIPPMSEVITGVFSTGILKDIDSGDLLGRDAIDLNTGQIEDFIKGKVILITGAAGSIGSELSRQVARFHPSTLLLLDQDETGIFNICEEVQNKFSNFRIIPIVGDVIDQEKINKIFVELKPDVVFHAAAYKHVPLMEKHPDEAIKNNVFGTENVALAAINNSTEKFVFISTDKAVNPVSVMGATKRVGEMICQGLNQRNSTKFISVRFGNVLDSRGSVIPTFREQIRRKGPVTVTHPDMKRYFMLTSEACLLVMQSGAMGQGGEVFVLDMGKPIKILNLAKEMIKLAGLEPDKDIPIVFSGVRPGEKMFEEILTAEEGIVATKNQKIFMAKIVNISLSDLELKLKELKRRLCEKEEVIKTLETLFPFFKSRV
ncbi:MAG: nucleoside-diphosphate sugar epimerase/dehydratase [Candidatus Staskawiczbacteria bacterium]|jgi:FlaA1/EpsC-like NDP-sugar epimerase